MLCKRNFFFGRSLFGAIFVAFIRISLFRGVFFDCLTGFYLFRFFANTGTSNSLKFSSSLPSCAHALQLPWIVLASITVALGTSSASLSQTSFIALALSNLSVNAQSCFWATPGTQAVTRMMHLAGRAPGLNALGWFPAPCLPAVIVVCVHQNWKASYSDGFRATCQGLGIPTGSVMRY